MQAQSRPVRQDIVDTLLRKHDSLYEAVQLAVRLDSFQNKKLDSLNTLMHTHEK